ncbi:rsmF [Symbiodinium microadriaticum]|nr:rsmF [Symbiodinium microadriaticum]CAE7802624.1 rsmF [Symbiodinium sp. KB8]
MPSWKGRRPTAAWPLMRRRLRMFDQRRLNRKMNPAHRRSRSADHLRMTELRVRTAEQEDTDLKVQEQVRMESQVPSEPKATSAGGATSLADQGGTRRRVGVGGWVRRAYSAAGRTESLKGISRV